ncbi:hypothetical protein N864_03165 [Intrasporangium chromatireducens Q5-1]|uniref:DUF4870 domain-containing protein n=1 Tax=Intrasporangium chromatireducens Q5-1 TaxID=584657 RepID=W9GL39_9MICO|nr:DUF4870 domain-containing protein [Intrasporangium chromatireducens]EWT05508.1 hypothetical protein N864_03165 [Intrasporangium chromatireducens Q5-1]
MTSDPLRQPRSSAHQLMHAEDERTWAALAHASALIAAIVSAGWLSFLGPLAVYLYGRGRSDFVRRSAANAFNFNILLWVATIAGWVLFLTLIGIPFALFIWLAVFVGSIVFHLLAALRAWRGELYRYPWTISILK